jgi:WD40 repeat protein
MSSLDTLFNNRYRAIYTVDERPDSKIWRCRDDQDGNLVLVAELVVTGDAQRAQLETLARQLATTQSDVVLPLTDHFAGDGRYYLVCRDPGGQDLDRTLRTQGAPLSETTMLRELQRMLTGLEKLHTMRPGLFLGDPTASDVWLNEQGSWFFTPFPFVRPIAGSPSAYRAPELAQPHAEPNAVSDIYSLGALSYHALTGWPPPSAEQLKAGMPLNPPRSLNPNVSALAEQGLLRALQLRAPNRYQTAREMRVALDTAQLMASRPTAFALDPATQPAPAPMPMPAAVASTSVSPAPAAYTPAPEYAGGPYMAPPPARRGMSVGCIVALAVGITLALGFACLAIALIFTPFRSVLSGAGLNLPGISAQAPLPTELASVPTVVVTAEPEATAEPVATLVPIALAEGAIALENAQAITQTREITGTQLGPVAFAPDDGTLAIGIGNRVALRDGQTLDRIEDLAGHRGRVTSIAWSADGSLLASGASDDNDIRVWEASTRRIRHVLSGHTGWIRSLAFSPDGATLASGSIDLTIKLWDARSGQLLQTLTGHSDLVGGVNFSPDGKQVASASRDGSVRLWDVATGKEVAGFSFQTGLADLSQRFWTTGVAFSPDGKTIAVGATDANVYLLDAATGQEIRRLAGHTNWIVIRGLAYSSDGKRLYSSGLDGTVRIWDAATGSEISVLEQHSRDIFAIALSNDSNRLVSASDEEGVMHVWDLAAGSVRESLRVGQGIITTVVFAPDNKRVALTGYNGQSQIRDLESDQTLPFTGGVATRPLAFISDTAFVAITDQGTAAIVDITTGDAQQLQGFAGRPIGVAASNDGKLVAACGEAGIVVVWNAATGDVIDQFQTELPVTTQVAFSYNDEYLAVVGPGSQPQIEIWDLAGKQRSQTLTGPEGGISGISLQPGGTLLAATSNDGSMRLWDIATGLPVRRIDAEPTQGFFTSVSFSPDGTMVATGALNGDMQLWDVRSGSEAARYSLPGGIINLSFSSDGATLAVSTSDGTVRFFSRTRG